MKKRQKSLMTHFALAAYVLAPGGSVFAAPKAASRESVKAYFASLGMPIPEAELARAAIKKKKSDQPALYKAVASTVASPTYETPRATAPAAVSTAVPAAAVSTAVLSVSSPAAVVQAPLADSKSAKYTQPRQPNSLMAFVRSLWSEQSASFHASASHSERKITAAPRLAQADLSKSDTQKDSSNAAVPAVENAPGWAPVSADKSPSPTANPGANILDLKDDSASSKDLGERVLPRTVEGRRQPRTNAGHNILEDEYIDKILADSPFSKDKKTSEAPGDLNSPRPSGVLGSAVSRDNTAQTRAPNGAQNNTIPIKIGATKQRGINVKSEVPSVRHVTMSPASKRFGGDDVEIGISPIYDVLIQMPEQVEYFRSSNAALAVTPVTSNANMVTLKLSAVDDAVPISLHLVDVAQNIYTFTIIGMPADLAFEYPKTIIVNKRIASKTTLGARNPASVINAMDVDDAIQIVVGDVPKTSNFSVEFISGKYQHYEGYAQYAFRLFRGDKGKIDAKRLNFTIWANDKRLDSGNAFSSSRNVEWTVEPVLSRRESRRRGYDVLRVFVQIRASILDLEDWTSAFITVNDSAGYTRSDFPPLVRSFRAPHNSEE